MPVIDAGSHLSSSYGIPYPYNRQQMEDNRQQRYPDNKRQDNRQQRLEKSMSTSEKVMVTAITPQHTELEDRLMLTVATINHTVADRLNGIAYDISVGLYDVANSPQIRVRQILSALRVSRKLYTAATALSIYHEFIEPEL